MPLPLQTFTGKLKTFTVYNGVFALWAITQIVLFAITTAGVSCSQSNDITI